MSFAARHWNPSFFLNSWAAQVPTHAVPLVNHSKPFEVLLQLHSPLKEERLHTNRLRANYVFRQIVDKQAFRGWNPS